MHVLIVDGLNLIRRVHAALAGGDSAESVDMDAVANSCRSSLLKILKRQHPSHALCVMDGAHPSWRHLEYPPYKADRKPMPAELAVSLPLILDQFAAIGVQALDKAGFEADDIIATIALRVGASGAQVTIVSTDKSFCQLVREGIRVYDHFKDRYLDRHHVLTRYEVEPRFLATLFALTGDPSVNVPGVKSVGVRTAAKLIHDHGDLEQILEASGDMSGHVGAKLRAGEDDARRAMRLLSLRTDVELGLNLRDFRLVSQDAQGAEASVRH